MVVVFKDFDPIADQYVRIFLIVHSCGHWLTINETSAMGFPESENWK